MERVVRSGLGGAMLALLVAVALAAAGWAHRGPALPAAAISADLALFIAGGGSAADLCGTTAGGDAAQRDPCPVCTVPGTLPQTGAAQPALPVARRADPAPFAATSLSPTACHPAWNGRAPPVV